MVLIPALIKIVMVIFFLLYCGAIFTVLYHLTRFGVGTQPKRLAAIFLLGGAILSTCAIISYNNIDFPAILNSLAK